jgi:hypothetical protein
MTKSNYRLCKITALALLIAGAACGGDSNPFIEFTSITPDHGPQSGGNIVVVKGSGFASPGAELNRFLSGNELAPDIQVVSNQELRVTMPAHDAAEAVDIEIFNGNGSATLEAAYSYNPTPTVNDASPGNGPIAGGTEVTVTGSGFLDLEAGENLVDFDGIPAAVLSVVSDTELTVESPPGVPPKLRDIRVTNANGSGTRATAFAYQGNGNSLLAYTRGLLGYGANNMSDPTAGQILHVDLETLTVETAYPAPSGEFNGVVTTATDGTSVFMRTVSGEINTMDPNTGVLTPLGRVSADNCSQSRLNEIEFHQGVLYGFCRRYQMIPHFGRINATTLEFTPIGPAPINNNSAGRTTLVSDGTTLYMVGRDQQTNLNRIVSINPVTGLLGPAVPTLLDSVRGGAFLNGKLYVLNQAFAGGGGGSRQAYLYELDINTGAATQIMPLGVNLHGLTVAP